MREKFKDARFTGTINIKMDDSKGTWIGDKKSIVNSIIQICESYRRNSDTLSLRQLYYQLVATDVIPNHDKVYKKIGSIKDDIVYAGLVDWDTFEDRGRVPITAYFEHSISDAFERTKNSYKLDRQQHQPNHIEVWTEKDAISGILAKVTKPYTIRLVVNKGYTSSTAVYEAYSRFLKMLEEDKKIVILYFGDHDPSGLDMIRDITDRLMFMFSRGEQMYSLLEARIEKWWQDNEYTIYDIARMEGFEAVGTLMEEDSDKAQRLFEIGKLHTYITENNLFQVIPIGLTMEQIRFYNPPHNPAKITDPRAAGYIREFGAVSWEVDALSPQIMREIVKEKIDVYMDEFIYNVVMSKESEDVIKITDIIDNLNNE